MPAYSEQEIIAGCRKKDRSVQEYLYKTHYSAFLKVCARYAKSMQDAEQLLNDGFLKIFTQIDLYKNTGAFGGWMQRIVVNTCLDYLRGTALKDELAIRENSIPIESSDIAIGSEVIERIEFAELVIIIQSLPALTRMVFNLFAFEGYSHKEISAQLNINEGTSCWHVHHARSILQKKLNKTDKQRVTYEAKRI